MNPAILALACALLAASPLDTLPAGAGSPQVSLKCAELRDALLRSGLTGDSVRALLHDVQAEADLLVRVTAPRRHSGLLNCGGMLGFAGALGGGCVGAVFSGRPLNNFANLDALNLLAASAACGGAGCLLGAAIGSTSDYLANRKYATALSRHRAVVNDLVRRYNRLASPRRLPCQPGRLF